MKIKVKLDLLDYPEEIAKIDQSQMLGTVLKTPAMMVQALEFAAALPLKKNKKLDQIVIAGMGGSAISGDIASNLIIGRAAVPVFVNRDYSVPAFVGPNTFFISLSYSGNTEETLTATREAQQRGAQLATISAGGKLSEFAVQHQLPLVTIPGGLQPRAALPFLLIPLLVCLQKLGFLSDVDKEVKGAAELLQKLEKEWGPANGLRQNPVKQLAKKLLGKVPVILANVNVTAAAGLRLKTQLNENSKATALFNLFPELDHNELVNLAGLKKSEHNFALVLLRDEADSDRTKKRIEVTKSLISQQVGGINEIMSQGKTRFSRLMSLVYFGDLLSVYLALEKQIDPTPVDAIVRLKKELGR